MGNQNLNNAILSNQAGVVGEFSIDPMNTDGVGGTKETFYQNNRWAQQWGYFNSVPDLKSAILMKAIWNVGKGYTCSPETEVILRHISGWGKDTFEDILFNMEVTKRIGGDALAEIIRDKSGLIINLKPLDPSSIGWYVDNKGIITRYCQKSKVPNGKEIEFKPEDILHLSNNRVADQIHGISDIDVLESTILADEENFADIRKVMHRQARPLIIFKLKTDDPSTISAVQAKLDQATKLGENIYLPDDDNTLSYEVVQVQVSDLILAWRDDMRNKFFRAIGLPQVVPGAGGNSTESESKVIYLAFEQIVEKEQRTIEAQIRSQLFLEIDLVPPASISGNLVSDANKDGSLAPQPSDTTAGVGR